MRQIVSILLLGFAVAGCAHHGDDPADATTDLVDGETAFVEHCAGCHEDGARGAPRIGVAAEWQGRSSLWQAVLMEHAKDGYFEMPARGGKPDLPDEVVAAAAEYMLEKTFPDRPQD